MSASQRIEPERTATRSTSSDPAQVSDEAVLLDWTVHLFRRDPGRVFGILAAALCAGMAGLLFFHSIVFGAVGALLILSSAAEFLFPIHYRLTSSRAVCSYGWTRFEIPWSQVRRIIAVRDGVKLSPLASPSRLDAFRGVLLRIGDEQSPGNRTEIMRYVQSLSATSLQGEDSHESPENGDV